MQDAVTNPTHAASQPNLPEPLEIPGYELLEELGAGGYGIVYRALQRSTGTVVARSLRMYARLAKFLVPRHCGCSSQPWSILLGRGSTEQPERHAAAGIKEN